MENLPLQAGNWDHLNDYLTRIFTGGSITPGMLTGASIMVLGDSISSQGWALEPKSASNTSEAWLMWAVLYSQGGLMLTSPKGKSPAQSQGGLTTSDMLTTYLPVITAHKPALCAVLGGANDFAAGAPVSTPIANLTAIYQGLLAAGILPVLCTMTPRQGPPAAVTALNTWIKWYARRNGLPVVDLFQTVVDTTTSGTFQASLTKDSGGHQNAAGSKLMGQAFWNAIKNYLSQETLAPLPGFNLKVAGDTIDKLGFNTQNSLFLVDTNADGVPDGWAAGLGTGSANISTAATSGVGKYWTVNRGSTDIFGHLNVNLAAAADGDRMIFVCELGATVAGVSGSYSVYLSNGDSSIAYAGVSAWTTDIPAGSVIAQEFFWQTGSSMIPYPQVNVTTAATAQVQVARMALYNLTAAGIA